MVNVFSIGGLPGLTKYIDCFTLSLTASFYRFQGYSKRSSFALLCMNGSDVVRDSYVPPVVTRCFRCIARRAAPLASKTPSESAACHEPR